MLRLRVGARIEVADGAGDVWLGRVLAWSPVRIAIGEERVVAPSAAVRLVSAVGLLRGPRMDWLVEKLSELGVERLVPLAAARSVGAARSERWQRIAREAAQQCGRARLLEIDAVCRIAELDPALPGGALRVLLDPAGAPLAEVLGGPAPVVLASGPEGGFTADEIAALEGLGFSRARLVTPLLRAETAAIAGAAGVMALSGR